MAFFGFVSAIKPTMFAQMSIPQQSENIILQSPDVLRAHPRNARTHPRRQIKQLAVVIKTFGFRSPILVDEDGVVLAGHARLAAARMLGLRLVPTTVASGLSDTQKRAFMIADNRLAQNAGWDREVLAAEISELSLQLPSIDLDVSALGFETGEIEVLLSDANDDKREPSDVLPPSAGCAVTRRGDLWLLGNHRILCGDARERSDYLRLMEGARADMVLTDPPYNVRIAGHVQGRGRVRHAEFAFASGEMTQGEFREFLRICLGNAAQASRSGSIAYVFQDWRHIDDLIAVGRELYDTMLNLVVWHKSNAGQGSFYRSAHELVGVFRLGAEPHQNNVDLGKHGRNRTNVWNYPGVSSFSAERNAALAMHPTTKPTALLADAMRDATSKGDIVLDPFLGSGSVVMAAEKVGRRAFGIEYEPKFVDVTVRRWQDFTKKDAVLDGDGRVFDEVGGGRTAGERGGTHSQANPPASGAASVHKTDSDYAEDWVGLCGGLDLPGQEGMLK